MPSEGFTSEIERLNTTTSGDQINPSIVALPNDRFAMTWSDRAGNDGDRGGIFGRIYNADLTAVTDEFVVNTLTSDWQSKSNIAGASNGNLMAIWHQSNGYVEGQILSASGEKIGSQFTVQEGFNGLSDVVADSLGNFWVVSTVNGGSGYLNKYSNTGTLLVDSQVFQSDVVAFDPVVTALSDGRVLVSWYDGRNTSGSDIYGQLITSEGALDGVPFVVNTTTAENQSKPAISSLDSGGFVVVWQSLLQDGDLAGIYARVFDSSGAGGEEFAVNTKVAGNQVNAYVSALSDGGFVIGWVDSAAPQQVYLQLYSADGSKRGEDKVVSVDDTITINNSQNIEFAELTGGSIAVVWDAWKGSRDIFGRTLSADVEPPLEDIGFTSEIERLNTTTSGDQINPSIVALPNDRFAMTWSDRAGNDGDRGGIFGRIYNADLTAVTDEFVVNTLTSDWQSKSNIAGASNGNLMAIWHQSNGYVEGQILSASGEKIGSQFTVQEGFNGLSDVVADSLGNFWVVSTVNGGSGYLNKYSNTGTLLVDSQVFQSDVVAFDPVVTALSDGRVLVSWYDGRNTSGSDIYGQLITSEGALDGVPFVVNTTTAENQSKPAISSLDSGGFVVVWQSLLQDGDLAGIYARVFDSSGAGGEEFAVNTKVAGNQVNAYVSALSDGGFVIGWVDSAAPQQVYLQLYSADGSKRGEDKVVSVDDTITINNSQNIEFAELTGGSIAVVWDAWKGSRDIFGRLASLEEIDTDLDGVRDAVDMDDDGDGVPDDSDIFPLDSLEASDTDQDGVGNNADRDDDNDGVADHRDAFPLIPLSGLSDFDNDGQPDECDSKCETLGMSADLDDDGDGMSDVLELANGLNPLDGEDCPGWYCSSLPNAITLVTASAFDFDGDGLTRAQEESAGTNWRLADSDGDGLTDGDEVSRSSNPLSTDSDGDSLSDSEEVELGTSPVLGDTDGDSMSDSEEIAEGLSPTDGSDCPRWHCGGLNLPAILGIGTN